jgi:hypothetical protein
MYSIQMSEIMLLFQSLGRPNFIRQQQLCGQVVVMMSTITIHYWELRTLCLEPGQNIADTISAMLENWDLNKDNFSCSYH